MNARGAARDWAGTALAGVATLAGLHALDGLIGPGSWLRDGSVTVVLLVALVGGVRHVMGGARGGRLLPGGVGLLATTLVLLSQYGSPVYQPRVLPDAGSLGRLGERFAAVAELIRTSGPPMPATHDVDLLMVTAAALAFLAADLLAVGLHRPALAGPVVAVWWLPALGLQMPTSGLAVAVAAVAWLLLLTTTTDHGVGEDAVRRRAGAAVAAVVVVVLALTTAGAAAAGPWWGQVTLSSLGWGSSAMRIRDDLDLRDSLGRRSGAVVLRYSITGTREDGTQYRPTAEQLGPLRVFTMLEFDGRAWARGDTGDDTRTSGELLVAATSDPDQALRETEGAAAVRVAVEVAALREDRLPIPVHPAGLVIDQGWAFDPGRGELLLSSPLTSGTTYVMHVLLPELTAEELQADSDVQPVGLQAALQVPRTAHTADVARVAEEVTAGAGTSWEQAVALQAWLRDSANFGYDTRVDLSGSDDAVWEFLQTRRGYCVQFATTMTVMARMLGIPARLAVGYLPGLPQTGGYVVTGQRTHAWPELFLAGRWVRFEPTPAVQSGAAPGWTTEEEGGGQQTQPPEDVPSAQATTGATPTVRPTTPGAAGPGGGGTGEPTTPWPGLLVLAAALGVAGGLRLRSRLVAAQTPEDSWAALRRRTGRAGVSWPRSATPRQVGDLLRDRLGGTSRTAEGTAGAGATGAIVSTGPGATVPGPAVPGTAVPGTRPAVDEAIDGLVGAVESWRYGVAPTQTDPAQRRRWVSQVVAALRGR